MRESAQRDDRRMESNEHSKDPKRKGVDAMVIDDVAFCIYYISSYEKKGVVCKGVDKKDIDSADLCVYHISSCGEKEIDCKGFENSFVSSRLLVESKDQETDIDTKRKWGIEVLSTGLVFHD